MPTLTRTGDVYVLNLGETENRFNPDFIKEFTAALDEIAAAQGPRALVTAADGKFWTNGLDLDWVQANPSEFESYAAAVQEMFARVLELPVPTIAAIQGHCFAAGAMLALAHDFRGMRADRGFFCLPEVNINIPFTRAMSALIQARLTPQVAHEVMTTGRRIGGEQALRYGIVDAAAGADEVLPLAIERAGELAPNAGPTLGTIKSRMYSTLIASLRDPAMTGFN
jgi:Delta3-Delta2-enoyl-CoA isomerase